MKLILQYPPSDNTYYSVVNGRKVLSKKGREFKTHVYQQFLLQNEKGKGGFWEERIKIEVITHAKDRRVRDINNIWKALCDALTYAGVWEDDEQIDYAFVSRGHLDKEKKGFIEVFIDIYK